MPIFDQGYQHWQGRLSGRGWRWLTIARQGVRTGLRSRWLRIALIAAFLPAMTLAAFLAAWGLIEQKADLVRPLLALLRDLPAEFRDGPREYRTTIWTLAYHYFFNIELYFSMFLVLLVGPSLISQDLRFNAIPLYFSKPLTRFDYFLGKLGVIGFFLGAVAVAPALAAYILGLLFSLDISVLRDTGRIFFASLGYGLVVVVSAGTLMLALSSLTRNSRYVGAMWIGLWLISGVVSGVLTETMRESWCPLTSYTMNLRAVSDALLDTKTAWEQIDRLTVAARANAADIGRMAPRPGPRFGNAPPRDMDADPRPRPRAGRRPDIPVAPWYWSAGILLGIFGLSAWILSFRVKSLDRLK